MIWLAPFPGLDGYELPWDTARIPPCDATSDQGDHDLAEQGVEAWNTAGSFVISVLHDRSGR